MVLKINRKNRLIFYQECYIPKKYIILKINRKNRLILYQECYIPIKY